MKLNEIVPWGRNATEYRRMFDLQPDELRGRILGCGDGPASFNAEMTALGHTVISVDPIYAYPAGAIRARVDATYDTIMAQLYEHPDRYVWQEFADPADLGETRRQAMERFLEDYDTGLATGRYRTDSLLHLAFEDGSFDVALCSHLLLLYSEHLDAAFHLAAAQEMLRVARTVRIFPVLTLEVKPSPHIEPLMAWAAQAGYVAELRRVPYEFQRGGHTMLEFRRDP